jgi:hypothetical protein
VSPLVDPRQHTPALVGLVLGAVAIVGLGTGALIGWAGGSADIPDPTTSVEATRASADHSQAPTPAPPASCHTPAHGSRDLGYFVGARQESTGVHVSFDRALLYAGQDARHEARVLGLRNQLRHGTLLVNQNPQLRDRVLSPRVQVCGLEQLAGRDRPTPVTVQQLLSAVAARGSTVLLDLTYDRQGRVAHVQEKDLP